MKNDFFKLMNTAVFGKTMENVRKHRGTNIVTIEGEKTIWFRTKLSYCKVFVIENLLPIEMKKSREL